MRVYLGGCLRLLLFVLLGLLRNDLLVGLDRSTYACAYGCEACCRFVCVGCVSVRLHLGRSILRNDALLLSLVRTVLLFGACVCGGR